MEMNHILIELLANITRLGDSIVLGVFSVVLSVYFLVIGYKRASLAIMLSFVIPASIIGILKIVFYTCHTNLWGIVSPSGHAAISLGVLGVSAMILVNICTGIWRKLIPVALFLLAIVIAISRTILGMHTDGDVIVGGLIGGIVVFAITKTIINREHLRRNSDELQRTIHPMVICILALIVLAVFYGIKIPSEEVMWWVAQQIRLNIPLC